MTQKILAAHAGLDKVEAGQLIEADLDLVLGNDITSPVAIHEMDKMTVKTVFDKDKIALVPDHFVPNKDIKSAEHCKCVRQFAMKHDITNYFEVGQMGIEHALLPEKGLTVAGDVIIGADSHTCTYVHLVHFLQVLVLQIWLPEWQRAKHGLKYLLLLSLILQASLQNG